MLRPAAFIVVPALALWLVPASAQADGATCIVSGQAVTLQEVTVSPKGVDAFQLGLDSVPVQATLPARCGAPLALSVVGSIELEAKRDDVWLRVSRDVTSADGFVVLKRGARVIDACIVNGRVRASAITYSDDVLEGEAKRPTELVTGVEIPCSALTLDEVEDDDDDSDDFMLGTKDPLATDGTHHYWKLPGEGTQVVLRAKPNTATAGRLVMSPSCYGCINLRQINAKPGWLFVETMGEGVRARGWVQLAKLKRVPDTTGVGRSYGCTGDHGGGTWGEGGATGSVQRWGVVRADTTIYASEGKHPWGRFAKAERVRVRTTPGAKWAELRHVPGLDGSPRGSPWLHGKVALDALTLEP
jgi:hypothetical protein